MATKSSSFSSSSSLTGQFSDDRPGGGEQRASPRKTLKSRAVLSVKGAAPLTVRTVDIGAQGVCLAFLQPLPVGLCGAIAIDLMIDGKLHTLTVQARAAHCVFGAGLY